MSDTILTEISKLNDFMREICLENGHEGTIFVHHSGETLYDAMIDILTSTGEIVVHNILLRQALPVYLQTHLSVLMFHDTDENDANRVYEIITRHFTAMGVEEFYVPVAITKYNKKSEFIEYCIVTVPKELWGNTVASDMVPLIKNKEFTVVSPHNENPFSNDPINVYQNYVDIITVCVVNKTLHKNNEIKTSD